MAILCRLGLHRWVRAWSDPDGGNLRIVCLRCGRSDRPESHPTWKVM